ncbi:MAG: hypothetical protein H7252_04235 [Cytophaga sp.]|nr:hypothetical protein [Undibacterium sp.]
MVADGGETISLLEKDGSVLIRAPSSGREANLNSTSNELKDEIKSDAIDGIATGVSMPGGTTTLAHTFRKMPDFPFPLVYGKDVDKILVDWQR